MGTLFSLREGGVAVVMSRRSTLSPYLIAILLVASLVFVTLPATLYYLNEIYRSSDSALGLEFAQVVRDHSAPDDLIMSNLPTIGFALDFYAERVILWQVMPADALAAAERASRSVYYLQCDNLPALPDAAPRLAEFEISPRCRLTRLR